jgi:hypothetical protein
VAGAAQPRQVYGVPQYRQWRRQVVRDRRHQPVTIFAGAALSFSRVLCDPARKMSSSHQGADHDGNPGEQHQVEHVPIAGNGWLANRFP